MRANLVTRANAADEVVITVSRTQATQMLVELEALFRLQYKMGGAVSDLETTTLYSLRNELSSALSKR